MVFIDDNKAESQTFAHFLKPSDCQLMNHEDAISLPFLSPILLIACRNGNGSSSASSSSASSDN